MSVQEMASEEKLLAMKMYMSFVSSDRSSHSDDVLVNLQLGRQPLFEILSIYAFI